MFKKILIANRGEIAVRILEACRKLGIDAVTVYSEADKDAPHVKEATESYLLGPAPVTQSYLQVDKLLEIAKQAGCDAVHPGYGLLSENAGFAAQVAQAGLVFIGPSPELIAALGKKTQARDRMRALGVPVVPGSLGQIADVEAAVVEALRLGYPVMLKASAGGGGIGMQAIYGPDELEKAWKMATARAKAYFGDDAMYLEKLIEQPRHIEIQLMADTHGTVVALYERECSLQRRHQKVIEEAPAPHLPEATRERMAQVAVDAATALGYTNAGTMEFLVDAQDNFYFLEMNTRIQVEHPVTELITGIDLVAEQIKVAMGERLSFSQASLKRKGHAIEARLYAEDPKTFMPSPGRITELHWPSGEGIRIDTWITGETLVTPHYDPMLAKMIAWGPDRPAALSRLQTALAETHVGGIKTNLSTLQALLAAPEVQAGRYDTGFIASYQNQPLKA